MVFEQNKGEKAVRSQGRRSAIRVKTPVGLSVAGTLVLVKIMGNCTISWFTHEFLNFSVYSIVWFFFKMGLMVILKRKMFLGVFSNLNFAPSVYCNPIHRPFPVLLLSKESSRDLKIQMICTW